MTSREAAAEMYAHRASPLIDSILRHVEAKIMVQYVPGERLLVYPDAVEKFKGAAYADKAAVRKTVKALYEGGGWDVKMENDQREGEWWEFR